VSFLEDMLEHARYAAKFVDGVDRQAFDADIQKQFAVLRALEVVGEAAKAIGPETRDLAPEIPWRLITAMRDKLIHHYFGVDREIVWATVMDDIPALISELERLLSRLRRGL
jgi:uncharacterized protein with HEPN domain